MALLSEFVSYLIKFLVFLVITVVAVICGAKYKKNKLVKTSIESEGSEVDSSSVEQ